MAGANVKLLSWGLCVVSSGPQEMTLDHQEDWVRDEAAAKGWRVGRVFRDVASGKDGPRRPVHQILAEVRRLEPALRPAWLLTIRRDRLSRGTIADSQLVLHELRKMGVSVWTRDQGVIEIDTATGEMIDALNSYVARQENEIRSEKLRAVYNRKRAAGERIGNRLPYGLLRDENGKVVADNERAEVVREAFRLRLEGKGYLTIGKRMATFAPLHVFKKGRDHPVRWIPTRVKSLLAKRAYVGPIIDEATFARAQRIAKTITTPERAHDRRRKYPWPLSGCVRCVCGRMLIGTICGNQRKRHRYYGCRDTFNHGGHIFLVPAHALETQFAALLGRLKASPQLVERWRKRAVAPISATTLEKKIKDLTGILGDIGHRRKRVWELHETGKVRAEDVQERLDILAEQRDELQTALANAKEQLAVARAAAGRRRDVEDLFRRAAEIFLKANVAEQNEIAKAAAVELGGFIVDASGKLKVAGNVA